MNILVTGANGFVGRELSNYLFKNGLNPFGLLRKKEKELNVKQQFIVDNFLEHTDWEPILKGMDVVIHTAGLAHAKNRADKDYYEINTEMTKKIALECAKAGVKRFVYISSIYVYGVSSSRETITLSTPLNPTTAYGHSKKLAEEFLQELHETGKLEIVIIRPPLVYGLNARGNIDIIVKAINYNVPLPFYTINNRRSMISLQNLCDCLTKCAIAPKASGNVFLVSDIDVSTPDFIKYIAKSLNKSPKFFPFPLKFLHFFLKLLKKEEILEKIMGSLQFDTSHIQNTLGWKPVVSIQETLKFALHNSK
jgi:nucleoside-diphosphate-sugar epimerase